MLVIGFFGRIMPQKGFEYLVEASRDCDRFSGLIGLVVAVAGDGGFIRERRAEIRDRGLEVSFRFLGFQADVQQVLQQVDAVVMPSLWEACGLVAMEALMSGRPLIASSCEGLREVTAGSPALSVPPRNATALADAITRVIASHQALLEEGARYIPVATDRFCADRTAEGLLALFSQALIRRGRDAIVAIRAV